MKFQHNNKSYLNLKMQILCIFLIVIGLPNIYGQSIDNVQMLRLDTLIKRELLSGQTHNYTIELFTGDYARTEVEQKDVDLVMSLFDPDGKVVVEMDSKDGRLWREDISCIAVKAGIYRIELKAYSEGNKKGNYIVKLAEKRTSTERDKQRIEAERYFNLGGKLYKQGRARFKEAINEYQTSLKLWRELGEPFWEAVTLLNLGSPYIGLSKQSDAINVYDQAAKIFQAIKDRTGESKAIIELGKIYSDLNQSGLARNYFEQALTIVREIKDRNKEVDLLGSLGSLFFYTGQPEKAQSYFEQSLIIYKEIKNRNGEGRMLMSLGSIFGSLNQYEKARDYFEQALNIQKELKDRDGEGETLINLGNTYLDLNQIEKARNYYERALTIKKEVKDRSGEANALGNLGVIYGSLSQYEKARDYFEQALIIIKEIKNRRAEGYALNSLGNIYLELNQIKKARDYYEQSLIIARELKNRYGEGEILNHLGDVYSSLNQANKAQDYYAKSLTIYIEIEDQRGKGDTCRDLMMLWKKRNKPRLAIFYGKQAIDAYQQIRNNIQAIEQESRQSFLKAVEDTYRILAHLLISQERLAESQQILNSFKDQAYFDQQQRQLPALTSTRRENNFSLRYKQISRRFRVSRDQLEDLEKRLDANEPNNQEIIQLNRLKIDLEKSINEFLLLLKQAETEFSKPPTKMDKVVQVPDKSQMQIGLRELTQQTKQKVVTVYTLIGEEKFSALIIPSDGEIKSVSYPIDSISLNKKVLSLWMLLQSNMYDITKLSKEIYDIVFKPLEPQLPKDTTTIMWSLDGNLRYIPMAALFDGKKFLVERYNNVVFTRADKERMTRAVSPVWTGVGFGSSQKQTVEVSGERILFNALPGVSQELSTIFKQNKSRNGVVTGEIFLDEKFSRENFLKALKQNRPLVHISSHFTFRPGDDTSSFLLLGDGTVFSLSEMNRQIDLFQGVELLILSACNTAAQLPDANGREIDSFAELAQRLGAGSVIATLWQVRDFSTAQLIENFYENKQDGKSTKVEALRTAQLNLLYGRSKQFSNSANYRNQLSATNNFSNEEIVIEKKYRIPFNKDVKKPFAHPYYWSPFVLFGNLR